MCRYGVQLQHRDEKKILKKKKSGIFDLASTGLSPLAVVLDHQCCSHRISILAVSCLHMFCLLLLLSFSFWLLWMVWESVASGRGFELFSFWRLGLSNFLSIKTSCEQKKYMWPTLTNLLRIYSQPQNLGIRLFVVKQAEWKIGNYCHYYFLHYIVISFIIIIMNYYYKFSYTILINITLYVQI